MFADRLEFISQAWVEQARDYLQARVDAAGSSLDGVRYALCEVMTGCPAHFGRPGNVAAWHARLDGQGLSVGLGEIPDADYRVSGDYHAVLQLARMFVGDPAVRDRTLAEALHRNGGPVYSAEGQRASGPAAEVFAGLHDALAARTVENPDLDERIARLGLGRAAQALDEQGYVILEGAISEAFAEALRETILERAAETGGRTAGMLLERGSIFEQAALHPWLYALGERLCGKGMLLGQLLGLRKPAGPGEIGLHTDYVDVREPFPSLPQMCTGIWALEDFTDAGGSTWVVPGSHRRKRHPRPEDDLGDAIPLVMPKGSIAVWDGALWRWQGDRRLDGDRVTLHSTYMQAVMRPYDDYLHIDPAILARNPPELATLAAQDDIFGKNNHAGQQRGYYARAAAVRRPVTAA